MSDRRILKYNIPVGRQWAEDMKGGFIVHVDHQVPGMVTVWVETADSMPIVPRRFEVFGTGHTIPPEGHYMGTAVDRVSGLVWHLYEFPVEDNDGNK